MLRTAVTNNSDQLERDRKRRGGECVFGEAHEEWRETFKKAKLCPINWMAMEINMTFER